MKTFLEFLNEAIKQGISAEDSSSRKIKRFSVFSINPGRDPVFHSSHEKFEDAHQAASDSSMENHSSLVVDNHSGDMSRFRYGKLDKKAIN